LLEHPVGARAREPVAVGAGGDHRGSQGEGQENEGAVPEPVEPPESGHRNQYPSAAGSEYELAERFYGEEMKDERPGYGNAAKRRRDRLEGGNRSGDEPELFSGIGNPRRVPVERSLERPMLEEARRARIQLS
jgi:hypothetical protein